MIDQFGLIARIGDDSGCDSHPLELKCKFVVGRFIVAPSIADAHSKTARLSRPSFYLGTHPESTATVAHVDHRSWHVGVAVLIQADRVRLRKTQQLSDPTSIDQVVGIHPWTHGKEYKGIDDRALRMV